MNKINKVLFISMFGFQTLFCTEGDPIKADLSIMDERSASTAELYAHVDVTTAPTQKCTIITNNEKISKLGSGIHQLNHVDTGTSLEGIIQMIASALNDLKDDQESPQKDTSIESIKPVETGMQANLDIIKSQTAKDDWQMFIDIDGTILKEEKGYFSYGAINQFSKTHQKAFNEFLADKLQFDGRLTETKDDVVVLKKDFERFFYASAVHSGQFDAELTEGPWIDFLQASKCRAYYLSAAHDLFLGQRMRNFHKLYVPTYSRTGLQVRSTLHLDGERQIGKSIQNVIHTSKSDSKEEFLACYKAKLVIIIDNEVRHLESIVNRLARQSADKADQSEPERTILLLQYKAPKTEDQSSVLDEKNFQEAFQSYFNKEIRTAVSLWSDLQSGQTST